MKKRSIAWDIALTLLTIGIWNIYVQIRQILDINEIYGQERYSFIKVILLSIITLGLYFVYYEYKMTKDLLVKLDGENYNKSMPWIMAIITFIGVWFIVDIYQQTLFNKIVDKSVITSA